MTDAITLREEVQLEVADAVEPIADEWDELALRTGAPPFARPGWISAWWSAFGRGSLSIHAVRREGALVAVLPLARRLGLLRSCSNAHTPVFECVALEPADATAVLAAALERSGAVVLERLDTTGRLSMAARQAAAASRSRFVFFDEDIAPYVTAGMSREQYERSFSGSRRHQTARKRRRLAEAGKLTFETFDERRPDQLEGHFEHFLRLEGSGWKASTGTAIRSRPDTLRFYTDVAAWAAASGLLRLSFLCLDGDPVAGWLLIGDEVHQYSMKTGFDEGYSRYSPGVLLAFEEIGHALDGGRTFELGPGMNRLKEDLHNGQRRLEQVGVFRRGAGGAVPRWRVEGRDAVYRRARENAALRKLRDAARRRLASTGAQIPVVGEALLASGGLQTPIG